MSVFVRIVALGVAVAGLATPALAQGGYPTCAQAQGIVARQGAAVIYTAPHIYDRYVAHAGFCPPGDYAKRAFAATVDSPACPIGFTCVTGDPHDDF